ncbi:Fic family protein [Nocardioides sp. InS609-2]|uniref:Fic family protein n=1 Tax=Nocardioides sp. InS609-2 TaxID=2760705 RepID=UPI0020BF1500|nr:Fic family protein [Nocardioides sp. InS609-2]
MDKDQPRQDRGTPAGGRWRAQRRAEVDIPMVFESQPLQEDRWRVDYEPLHWDLDETVPMPRRERAAARGPYQASIPPFINDLPIELDETVSVDAAEATMELARFDAEMTERLATFGPGEHEMSPMAAVLLRTESASSSQIEQITANARNLALASIGEKTGENAQLVATNTDAMRTAIALSEDISPKTILAVQNALLADSAPEHAGKWRESQVWIGGRGSTPHSATFVPPTYHRVPELIDDLVDFTRRVDVQHLVQAAIAHAQFETIHPFPDGNGRTGRALVHAMLRNSGVTQRITVPVSSGLLTNVEDYYEALGEYREGDLNPIVQEFTRAAFRSIDNGRILVDDLVRTHASWLDRVKARSDAAVWRALPLVVSQPAVTVNYLMDNLAISQPAALRAVNQMIEAGVLESVGNPQRSRVWAAPEVTSALDEFAARAGRRSFGT